MKFFSLGVEVKCPQWVKTLARRQFVTAVVVSQGHRFCSSRRMLFCESRRAYHCHSKRQRRVYILLISYEIHRYAQNDIIFVLVRVQIGDPLAQGIQRGLCAIGQVQLIQDIAGILANSALAQVKLLAYLAV